MPPPAAKAIIIMMSIIRTRQKNPAMIIFFFLDMGSLPSLRLPKSFPGNPLEEVSDGLLSFDSYKFIIL